MTLKKLRARVAREARHQGLKGAASFLFAKRWVALGGEIPIAGEPFTRFAYRVNTIAVEGAPALATAIMAAWGAALESAWWADEE